MNKITNTSRNNYLDIVKGVLIICVVVGHCIQYGSGRAFYNDGCFFEDGLFKFIYSFHMPLFMLLCGYFFAFSIERRRWKDVLKSKIKSLLVPILVWSLIPIVLFIRRVLVGTPDDITFKEVASKLFSIVTNNLWFLWAILYNVVIVLFVNRLCRDNLWAYVAIFVAQFFLPDALYLYCYMYPYFVLGYLYNKQFKDSRIVANVLKHKVYWHIVVGVVFFALLCLFERKDYIYTSRFNILNGNTLRQLGIDVFRFIIGLIGSLFVLFTVKYLHGCIDKHRGGVFANLGRETMGIYIISSYLNPLVLKVCHKLNGCNYFYIIVESAIIIGLSLLLTLLIKHNRTASRILLGS